MTRRKKELHEFYIEKNVYPNRSISTFEGEKVLFRGGIVGQKVEGYLGRERDGFREGTITDLLCMSFLEEYYAQEIIRNMDREEEVEQEVRMCESYDECSGCYFQTIFLEDEVDIKREMVRDLLDHYGIEDWFEYETNPNPFEYRNKMEYSFGDAYKDGPLVLGLNKKGKYYEKTPTLKCNLVDSDFRNIREWVESYFREKGTSFYNKIKKEGFLRYLVVKKGHFTEELMVHLVTTSKGELDEEEFVSMLKGLDLSAELRSVIWTISDTKSDAVVKGEQKTLYGDDYITESINGLLFRIYPFSFFQPNVFMIRYLYSELAYLIGKTDKRVYDLYSGTGTISLILSKYVKEVVGVELVEEAVAASKINKRINNIENVEFICQNVDDYIDSLDGENSVVVLDPPRSGINPKTLDKLIEKNISVIAYISCNPQKLMEDSVKLREAGYKIKKIQVFDQFTRTYHLEMVMVFEKE